MMEGSEVVVGNHDQCSLIETPLHRIVKLLAEDTRAVEGVWAAMRGIWRSQFDVGRVVGDGEVVTEVFGGLCVLLLRKTRCDLDCTTRNWRTNVPVEAYSTQVGRRKGHIWRV